MVENVAVYFDWQNAYKGARRAFDFQGSPNEIGNFCPYRLACLLAAGNDRGESGKLVCVEIHRGLPSSGRDPVGYGANRRQSQAWMTANPELVFPRLRPLRYPGPDEENQEPVEKGIDTQLALAAVEGVLLNVCDVAIIVSHDSDLVPAVETICKISSANHVETASWNSPTFSSRLKRMPGVFNHFMRRDTFDAVATPINYAHAASS